VDCDHGFHRGTVSKRDFLAHVDLPAEEGPTTVTLRMMCALHAASVWLVRHAGNAFCNRSCSRITVQSVSRVHSLIEWGISGLGSPSSARDCTSAGAWAALGDRLVLPICVLKSRS
jgi:hypothetical protein